MRKSTVILEGERSDSTIESKSRIGSDAENEEIESNEDDENEKNEDEDEDVEEETEESGDEEREAKSEEYEAEEEVKTVKHRRCQRKKKKQSACIKSVDDGSEEGEEEEEEDVESEGDEEEEEEIESHTISSGSSILSAITFQWENEIYEFEELCDPGTIENIFYRYYTEPDFFDEIGQNRYLEMCRVLSVTPSVRFYHALTTEEVDLSHRQIGSKNIRAMCAALETNTFVKKLILKFNRLLKEDCFYIGLMLYYNEVINTLDLTGCRVGPDGIEALIQNLPRNENLVNINLSKCNIQDEGMKLLSHVLIHNNCIEHLDLSFNKLEKEAAEDLGIALKINKCVTHLNLSYNYLFDTISMKAFFRDISVNDSVTHLNLSWNGLNGEDIGKYIGNFLKKNETILFLDLSDNRLQGLAITAIKKGLARSTSLKTLKLGRNPMSQEDLDFILSGAKACSSLGVLDLEDIWVKKSFMKTLKKIQLEREIEVNVGGILGDYEVHGPDYPKLILQRAQFEAMKPKKKKRKRDFGHLIWTLGDEPVTEEEFMTRVRKFKAKIRKELFSELIKQFTIPKAKLIDVVTMKEKYLSLFPESTPPPPPKVKNKTKKSKRVGKADEKTSGTEKNEKVVDENLKQSAKNDAEEVEEFETFLEENGEELDLNVEENEDEFELDLGEDEKDLKSLVHEERSINEEEIEGDDTEKNHEEQKLEEEEEEEEEEEKNEEQLKQPTEAA